MKKSILTGIIFAMPFLSFSQVDTPKIERYCEIVATPRLLSNKVTININYGEEKGIWKIRALKMMKGN